MGNSIYHIAGFTVFDAETAKAISDANIAQGESSPLLTNITSSSVDKNQERWALMMRNGYQRYGVVWKDGVLQQVQRIAIRADDPGVFDPSFIQRVSTRTIYAYFYAPSFEDAVRQAEQYWETEHDGAEENRDQES